MGKGPGRAGDNGFEGLLSSEEVARACGLSRRAVYRAIARGELPAARLCHRLRVRPADLELWIAERTLSCPTDTAVSIRTARATARGSLRPMLDEAREDCSEQLP
ncbi:MAG: helix-turn-helix domain-containing protein [Gaiellaceae bacterium]